MSRDFAWLADSTSSCSVLVSPVSRRMKGLIAALLTVGLAAAASSAATAKIPAAMLTLHQQAAITCPDCPGAGGPTFSELHVA